MTNDSGIHSRPATLLVQIVTLFSSEVILECKGKQGVASGKCGFTTIRKFQIKKPNFSTNQNREIELFELLHLFIEFINWKKYSGL